MRNKKMDNQGMSLIELTVCFVILSALLVVATQIIHSTAEVYYYTKTNSFGVQASQIVATELRGDIEDSLPKYLIGSSTEYIRIDNSSHSIEFIDNKGSQVKYQFVPDPSDNDGDILKRVESAAYDSERFESISSIENGGSPQYDESNAKLFNSKYIGMGYVVKDISFTLVPKTDRTDPNGTYLLTSEYPVLKMTITVGNNQFGEYVCDEYVPLYNMYGIAGAWDRITVVP